VYLDDRGEICLVEVKKEGNPDTRRVVAQLLDYAAALCGKSLEEFERDVVLPYFVTFGKSVSSLREFLSQRFGAANSDHGPDELDAARRLLRIVVLVIVVSRLETYSGSTRSSPFCTASRSGALSPRPATK
jgi:hypothetical protein